MTHRIMTVLALACLVGVSSAQGTVTIDDFGGGVDGWRANDPRVAAGGLSYAQIVATDEAKEGFTAMRVSFEAGSGWAVVQHALDGGGLAESASRRISFWLKPDGSGKTGVCITRRTVPGIGTQNRWWSCGGG